MLLAKPVKKVFAKAFPSRLPNLKDQIANIPIRHFNFKFSPDELDVKFFMQKDIQQFFDKIEQKPVAWISERTAYWCLCNRS